jgi:lactoylglutathione lyase
MRFGYTILYVADVLKAVEFHERAFKMKRAFVAEGNQYAELDTGTTKLAFASYELARSNLPDGFKPNNPKEAPAAIEIAYVTDDVAAAFRDAVTAGAMRVKEPQVKPWGQTVAYVRDPDGVLIELASEMAPG